MRKLIKRILIAGLGLGALVVLPLVVSGQMQPAECCRLSRAITVQDYTFALQAAVCAFNAGPTNIAKDTVVGAGDCVNVAPEPDTCVLKGVSGTVIVQESPEWGTVCLLNGLYNVTDWIFYFFLAIAILIGVIAGFLFMTAAGDPGKVDKARGLLMYMVIGLIVAALAKVIPTMVRAVIGF